jgi:hypothetical protein
MTSRDLCVVLMHAGVPGVASRNSSNGIHVLSNLFQANSAEVRVCT